MVEVMRLDGAGATLGDEEIAVAETDDRIAQSPAPAAEMPMDRGDPTSS